MKKMVFFVFILFLLITNVYAFSIKDKISSFSIKDVLTSFFVVDFFNKLFGIKEDVIGINVKSDSTVKPTETSINNVPISDSSTGITPIIEPTQQPITNIESVEDSNGVTNIITQEPIVITQDNVQQPVPILNGYLSVATLKQSYFTNEVIELTDPPKEGGFFSKLIEGIKSILQKEVKGEQLKKEINFKNLDDIIIKEGWPIETEFAIYSSPVIVDIDGDNSKEIIVATGLDYHGYSLEYSAPMRKIYVWDTNGNLKQGWPKSISDKYNSPPSVADLDGDGDLEIILFSRQVQNSFDDGFIYAWHHDGSSVSGWPILFSDWEIGVPPMIVDLNNDNSSEVIVSVIPSIESVQIYNNEGVMLPNWPQSYLSRFYGGVGNLDEDLEKEFVITSQVTGGFGLITALNLDGTTLPGWPKIDPNFMMPDGSVVLGDLDNNGINEIILPTIDGFVYVFQSDGEFFSNWPVRLDSPILPSLVLGDLNNDENVNIIGVESTYPIKVHVWNAEGQELSGFPVEIPFPDSDITISQAPPIILDIDGDNYPEIILVVREFGDIKTSYVYVVDHDGQIKNDENWPLFQGIELWHQHSSLAVDDIDRDNMLELVSAYSKYNPDYPEIGYGGGEIIVYDLDSLYDPLLMEWPMFQHDPQHTGLYSKNLEFIKSKIQNTGTNVIQGYLLMKIQKNNNGVWQDYSIIVNDLSTGTLRTINGNSYLALDEIWNVNNVMINQIGSYRVYTALLNSNGNIIQTQQGSLEDTYEFTVTPSMQPINQSINELT